MGGACYKGKDWIAWVMMLLPFILYFGLVVLVLLGVIGATNVVATTKTVTV
jgi:hypothetical protein